MPEGLFPLPPPEGLPVVLGQLGFGIPVWFFPIILFFLIVRRTISSLLQNYIEDVTCEGKKCTPFILFFRNILYEE